MSEPRHAVRFPGENEAYRQARNELLEKEIELRQRLADVAALRRNLPEGGLLKEDYVFSESTGDQRRETRFSQLFAPGKRSLILYSYMFGGDLENPCPMCTSFLDGLDRAALHVE